jgi:uncharacterized protein YndB with AHSA1/START domain
VWYTVATTGFEVSQPPTLLWAGGSSFSLSAGGKGVETTIVKEHDMIQIISNTRIYQPIKRVFDFISTPENDFQWQYGTLASTRISEITTGLGGCFQSTSLFMGNRIQSTFEVTEYEPNSRYGFKSLSGPLQSFTSYALEIARGCTQVKLSIQANIVNLIGLSENVLEKKMKRQLKENLEMLKNILETG